MKKNHKKIWWTIIFVAINVAVIALTAISEFGNSANAAELREVKINWWFLIPAVGCFIVALLLDIFKYVLMIRRLNKRDAITRRDAWKLAWRVVLLGRYYDNITPAAVGGQPFQIYYMHKNGRLPSGLATTIPLFGMISLQIGFMMIALTAFLTSDMMETNPTLMSLAWVGLAFYAFWPVMVFMATFLPKLTTRIIKLVVRFLARIRIIKNRNEALKKVEHEVKEYVGAVKMILKKPGLFGTVILISVVYNILVASIPWFVLTAFGGDVDYLWCAMLTVAVKAAVYFVPTPGNSGAAEGTFYVVFSALSTGYVFWAMLVWRMLSYYIYIIMGPITYFFIHLDKKRGKMR